MKLRIFTVVSEPFSVNSYTVSLSGSQEALVIDPGFFTQTIFNYLEDNELVLSAILNTHGHMDHIAGNYELKKYAPTAPIIIGVKDALMLTDPQVNLSAQFGLPITSPAADRTVADGDSFTAAGIPFEVIHIPGHSPGHVAYLFADQPSFLFGGDILFRGSIGRTDFPDGSYEDLIQGIQTRLLRLPKDTLVYPGHGPVTTIGHEILTNPFLGSSR